MHVARIGFASAAVVGLAAPALATITFTFADPGSGPEVTHVSGGGGSDGSLTYTSAQTVNLMIDGVDDGVGAFNYTATVNMNLSVGLASTMFGVTTAPVSGAFSFDAMGGTILSGNIADGAVIVFGSSGAVISSSTNNTLTMTAGGDFLNQLQGAGYSGIIPVFDASFAISDIHVTGPGGQGYAPSFTGNLAFVGNAEVPAPGAVGVLGLAGLAAARRRR